MKYGTTGSVIKKEAVFGKTLTNGNSAIADYKVFSLTVYVTHDSTKYYFTFPFVRSNGAHQMGYINGYWYEFVTSLNSSSNTFTVTARRSYKLVDQITSYSCTIYQIRGLG